MAWSTPLTATASTLLTAAQWNASVRDNLLETSPAKATTAGSHMAVSGANTLAERMIATAATVTSETTTSTTYVDLATVGPSVTVTASGRVLALWTAVMSNSTATAESWMAMDISGAHTLGVSNNAALHHQSGTANNSQGAAYACAFAVTSGSSTYTPKYRVSAGTGTFLSRRNTVLPF